MLDHTSRSSYSDRPPGSIRGGRAESSYLRPASWLFLLIAIMLIGVLAYYLSLTTRPEISQINPPPNSAQPPGIVEIGAVVNSQRALENVQIFVDGEAITPVIEQTGNHQWIIAYEQVFERGERQVVLQVTDS